MCLRSSPPIGRRLAREEGRRSAGVMPRDPSTPRVGVRLADDEWAVVLEALRRFAHEQEAVGRSDRAVVTHRVLSKLVTYRVRARAEALDDEADTEEGS
jgi:hypothetical protein